MKKIVIPVLLFLLGTCSMLSQSAGQIFHREESPTASYYTHPIRLPLARESAVKRRPYNVLRYELTLDWRAPLLATTATGSAREFTGINEITLRIDSANVSSLVFDATSMEIQEIIFNNTLPLSLQQPTNRLLTIPLPKIPSVGDTLILRLGYRHISEQYPNHFDPNNKGFYLYPKGYSGGSSFGAVQERLAYTLGAPDDARYWMPCNDAPYDKAIANYTVTVPKDFITACNGVLTATSINKADSSLTYRWQDTSQIATYLMVVHASKYYNFHHEYKRGSDTTQKIPVEYYVWRSDSAAAVLAFRKVPAMMERFSRLFGEFPFAKYGMAAVQPFLYGGMENQTMTSITRDWLNNKNEDGIAHELMHEWWGDKVTPATWNDIWMNEGAATYGEAVWYEGTNQTYYKNIMNNKRTAYMSGNTSGGSQPPCYRTAPVPMDINILYNYAVTYAKGAWVYHILRKMTGDSLFFNGIRNFFARHAFQSAETEELIASLEKDIPNPPIAIRTFFDQWVYGQGHPIYEPILSVSPDGGGGTQFKATLTIRQEQMPQQVFKMPLDITFTDGTTSASITVLDTLREQTFMVTLPFAPTAAVLDPNDKILCVKNVALTGVEEEKNWDKTNDGGELLIEPNPVPRGGETILRFTLDKPEHTRLEIFDIFGKKVAGLFDGNLEQGKYFSRWNSREAEGVYIARATIGGKTRTQKMVVR